MWQSSVTSQNCIHGEIKSIQNSGMLAAINFRTFSTAIEKTQRLDYKEILFTYIFVGKNSSGSE
jgi:hypothetical protein